MTTYGYVRVSAREQNEERQIVAMEEFGVMSNCIVLDKQSGRDFARPGYRRLLRRLKAGRYPGDQEYRPAGPRL